MCVPHIHLRVCYIYVFILYVCYICVCATRTFACVLYICIHSVCAIYVCVPYIYMCVCYVYVFILYIPCEPLHARGLGIMVDPDLGEGARCACSKGYVGMWVCVRGFMVSGLGFGSL